MKTRGFLVGGRHIGYAGRVQCGVERRVKGMEERERKRHRDHDLYMAERLRVGRVCLLKGHLQLHMDSIVA